MDPVLIAAAKFELDPLANALQERGHTPLMKLVGVGAINAAKRARTVAEACRGRDVIFVGTCGTFGTFTKVSLIKVQEVVWLPTCERLGFSYTIKDTAPPISLPPAANFCRSLPEKRVVCSPSISLISKLPDGWQADQHVENVELYSCIGDIAAQAASLTVILAITNSVGPDSHSQWKQSFTVAAGATAEYIGSRLKQEC